MVQIAQHRHCLICGRAMEYKADARACSPECQAQLDKTNKKRRNYMLMLYGLMAASMAYLVLALLRGGG